MAARTRRLTAGVVGGLIWSLGLSLVTTATPASAADPAEPPPFVRAFGPDGTSTTDFSLVGPSAVDQGAGVVYVADKSADKLYGFAADGTALPFGGSEPYISGNEIAGLSLPEGPWESQVAVDSGSHVIYVTSGNAIRAFEEDGEAAEFTAGPGAGTSEIPGFTKLLGVAVDASGNIYASDYATGVIKVFSASGEFLTQIETPTPSYLGVASDGILYSLQYAGELVKFSPSEVPVTAATTFSATPMLLEQNKPRSFAVDPSSGNLYIAELVFESGGVHRISVYDSSGVRILSFAGPGEEGELKGGDEGISVNGSTGAVYVSTGDFSGGTFSKVEIFAPEPIVPGSPEIISTSVADVTSGSAVLQGVINPRTFATSYFFEYGLEDCGALGSACLVAPASPVSIGEGHKGVTVAQGISGLQGATTYHFRLVAANSEGIVKGLDRTFATQSDDLVFDLADRRAWEMVSPGYKSGGVLGSFFGPRDGIIQASVDGNGLVYQSLNSIEDEPDGSRAVESSSVLARRSGNVWQSKDITAPHTRATNISNNLSEYNLFSLDLSRGLLEPRDATPLSEAASERTPYLRGNSEPPVYTPLVTAKEGFANVPLGTKFGGNEPGEPVSPVIVRGANPELTDIVLGSDVPLVEDAVFGTLYVWRDGQLEPASVLPAKEGKKITQGILGSGPMSIRNAISDDGSRVFWGAGTVGTSSINLSALYVHEEGEEESHRLDVPQAGASEEGSAIPAFQGASDDGEVVFFTDSQQLTEDASPSGRDLYRCEIADAAQGCSVLTDISAPIGASVESAAVQGIALGINADGTKAYFVAKGVLTDESNERGEDPVSGAPNLYMWGDGDGLRFVASLSKEDDRDWGQVEGETPGYFQNLTSAMSPDGRYLAFMSSLDLTDIGGDGADERAEQVFRYDADTGNLSCASCDPTGAEAAGQASPPRFIDRQGIWDGRQIGGMLPPMLTSGGPQALPYPLHPPRSVLNNGRVYFEAFDSLVPGDSNGTWDVYQYEPSGVGDCDGGASGSGSAGVGDACVSLVSAGTAPGPSGFLDTSLTGDDVFFLTRGRLSVTDEDDVYDVYDARVDGVAAVKQATGECAGQDCRSASAAPDSPMGASETFHGAGNIRQQSKRCPKGKHKVVRKGKQRCVPKKKHHSHKQRRARR